MISRTGLPAFTISSWFGVMLPGGTPAALVERWGAELNRALASPDVQRRVTENGLLSLGGTQEGFKLQIAADRARWGGIIREHDIKPD